MRSGVGPKNKTMKTRGKRVNSIKAKKESVDTLIVVREKESTNQTSKLKVRYEKFGVGQMLREP